MSVPATLIENGWQCSTESSKTGDQRHRRNGGRYIQCVYGSKFDVLCYDNLTMLYTCCVFLRIIEQSYGTKFTMSMFLFIYVHVLWTECRTQSQHEDSYYILWKCGEVHIGLHKAIILCQNFIPEKVDVNQKGINCKWYSYKK